MSVKGFIRVSGNKQDEQNQRHEILEYCNPRQLFIAESDWFSFTLSTRKAKLQTILETMTSSMHAGDMLIVTELSRLGRNLRQVLNLIFELRKKEVTIICIKERLEIGKEENLQNTLLITIFSMLYEVERSFISMRTKEALNARKARGVKLGRKPGKAGKTKIDESAKIIKELVGKGVSITSIAKIIDAKRSTVDYFVRTRKLKAVE
jgi:DNA invertase Pin-like site-specific DNA recombinase